MAASSSKLTKIIGSRFFVATSFPVTRMPAVQILRPLYAVMSRGTDKRSELVALHDAPLDPQAGELQRMARDHEAEDCYRLVGQLDPRRVVSEDGRRGGQPKPASLSMLCQRKKSCGRV